MLVDHNAIATLFILSLLFYKCNSITIPLVNIGLKIKLPNSIKIYANKETVDQITCLVNKYLLI